jgi:hypothetical protein
MFVDVHENGTDLQREKPQRLIRCRESTIEKNGEAGRNRKPLENERQTRQISGSIIFEEPKTGMSDCVRHKINYMKLKWNESGS